MRLYSIESEGYTDCNLDDIVEVTDLPSGFYDDYKSQVIFKKPMTLTLAPLNWSDTNIWYKHTKEEILKMIEIEKFNNAFENKLL